MKIDFLLNLEKFMNICIQVGEFETKAEIYREVLEVVKDWEIYTENAVKLANQLRRLLDLEVKPVEAPKIDPEMRAYLDRDEKQERAIVASMNSRYSEALNNVSVLSPFEIDCLQTFVSYEGSDQKLTDKQAKIWAAIQSKIRKARGMGT